jgi:AGZA family xanthine/uracil permease-like MFS transporter
MTLMIRRVRGAILIGIVVTGVAGVLLGMGHAPARIFAMPFTGAYSLAPIALQLDIAGVLRLSFLPILLTLFLMSFLDTLGTLVGVGAAGGMLDDKGNFPGIEKPMTVDAIACIVSGLVGTSTSGAYIESATGIEEGGRTGLTGVVVAVLFLASLVLAPLFTAVPPLATAPALIVVGALMMEGVREVDWKRFDEAIPAFLTVIGIPFTYSIANGIALGLVSWVAIKLLSGRWREVHWLMVVLAVLLVLYYAFLHAD